MALTLAFALVRPADRALEEWLVAALVYAATPRQATWQPAEPSRGGLAAGGRRLAGAGAQPGLGGGRRRMKHASVQTARLGIEAIQDGVVSLVGGEYRAVLEVSGTASPFEDDARQEALLAGFATFLNALSYPIQILVRASPVDLTPLRRPAWRSAVASVLDGQLAALAHDHAAFVQGLARQRTLLERRFYVVVPGREPRARAGLDRLLPGVRRPHERRAAPRGRAAPAHLPLRRPRAPAGALRAGRAGAWLTWSWRSCIWRAGHPSARARSASASSSTTTPRWPCERRTPAGRWRSSPMLRLQRRRTAAQRRRLSGEERRFALGTRSLADLLAPAAVEVARDHLRLEYQYARVLVVVGYPRTVAPGWLTPLLEFEHPIEVSLHVHPLETASIVKLLEPQAGPAAILAHGRRARRTSGRPRARGRLRRRRAACATRSSAASSASSRSVCTCCCAPARSARWTT